MNKKKNWFIIIIFLVLIFGIAAFNFLAPAREFSERENRSLAQSPKLTLGSYMAGKFAADYESYITDQFVMRDSWIGIKTAAERATLKQEIGDIYFAADGYLIEKHTGSFQAESAERNISYLASFMEQSLEKYGAGHVKAIVVPNAVQVIKDKLPPYAAPDDGSSYLIEIYRALPEGTWLDSAAILGKHKEEYLYYKTDHHWTTLAAYYVYEEWAKSSGLVPLALSDYEIETVADDFKGTIEAKVGGKTADDSIQIFKPKEEIRYTLDYNEGQKNTDSLYHMEALETKDKYTVFFGGNQPVVEAKMENDSDRRLLVIKDSYAHCFLPFTFQDFKEVDFIDLRYYNKSLREYMEANEYTDVLFLYNISGFAEDPNVAKLMN